MSLRTQARARERTRRERRQVPCQTCGAAAGERCKGPSGYRKSLHRGRGIASTALVVQQHVSVQLEHGDRFDQFVKAAAQSAAARYEEEAYYICERCESPIEALIIAAMQKHSGLGVERFEFFNTDKPNIPPEDEVSYVYTQICVGEYRVDILILDASVPLELREPSWLIVECDGHDYHERTKEQAKRDKKRDRFFTAKGFKLLRFTGSEIWASPDACVEEIVENLNCNMGRRLGFE